MARKVAIVAKGGTSALAPWHDTEWEIWGIPWISYPRVDRLFDVHEYHSQEMRTLIEEKSFALYPETPVYTAVGCPIAYPNKVVTDWGGLRAVANFDYRQNSICYMVGKAIEEGVSEIALFGVHMMGGEEYEHERPFLLYILGVAEGRGIKVTNAPGSPLFMSPFVAGRYGADSRPRRIAKMGNVAVLPNFGRPNAA